MLRKANFDGGVEGCRSGAAAPQEPMQGLTGDVLKQHSAGVPANQPLKNPHALVLAFPWHFALSLAWR